MATNVVANLVFEVDLDQDGSMERHEHLLRIGEPVKFGRSLNSNLITCPGYNISRNHLEFFSVEPDPESTAASLVYVRDRQSVNGTFVNGLQIGKGSTEITPAYLLQDGDIVEVKSNVRILVQQPAMRASLHELTNIQKKEVKMFEDQYIVTNRVLGEGGFARVHLAIDARTKQQVVCKIHDISKSWGGWNGIAARQALREVDIWCQLDHPNIVSFKRAYRTPHTLYTFAELATGGDFFSMIYQMKRFQEIEVRWVMRQLLHGLSYLNSKGVAHRDLKPENIFCTVCPSISQRIVIGDFGCANVLSSGRITSASGSHGYHPPEQISQDGHDQSVDMWAVGALCLSFLLGLDNPFDPDIIMPRTESGSIAQGQSGSSPNLEGIFAYLNHDTRIIGKTGMSFIRSCLEFNPSLRMTVDQALKHPWLTQCEIVRRSFATYQESISDAWTPRVAVTPVLQILPDVLSNEAPDVAPPYDFLRSNRTVSPGRAETMSSSSGIESSVADTRTTETSLLSSSEKETEIADNEEEETRRSSPRPDRLSRSSTRRSPPASLLRRSPIHKRRMTTTASILFKKKLKSSNVRRFKTVSGSGSKRGLEMKGRANE